jgi:hypothetical protein
MENKYYVYCHCFTDTNEIFYIGKGCDDRYLSSQRTSRWKNLTINRGYYAMKIRDKLSEDSALELEFELLQEFKPEGNSVHTSNRIKRISFELMDSVVSYDETSPTFLRYKIRRANGAYKPGDIAGSFDSDGYGQIYVVDKLYKIHRIIYCLHMGCDLNSNLIIDHIDRNKSNNNINNLRLTSHSENGKNVNWSVLKPSNTGEQAISLRSYCYRVSWSDHNKQRERTFSFGVRSGTTKEAAFELAMQFRNSLVDSGLIRVG